MTKETYKRIGQIMERGIKLFEQCGVPIKIDINYFMDIEIAVEVFDIDVDRWLGSEDTNFLHDFTGIYNNIDRSYYNRTHKKDKEMFGLFVPRFAKNQ